MMPRQLELAPFCAHGEQVRCQFQIGAAVRLELAPFCAHGEQVRCQFRLGASSSRAALRFGRRLLEESVDELFRVEVDQIVDAFTEADKLHGNAELALDGKDNAALG